MPKPSHQPGPRGPRPVPEAPAAAVRPRPRRFLPLAAGMALLLSLTGCAGPAEGQGAAGQGAGGTEEIMWFAPSSFTDVAGPLAAAYEETTRRAGDPVQVTVNLGSSAQLIQQINSGAAPDVLVTADEEAPGALVRPEAYARVGTAAANGLVLVVGQDTPFAVEDGGGEPAGPPSPELLDWLTGARVAVCAPEVPCGRAAHTWLAGRPDQIVADATQEANVRAVLAKVASGQADAGFVYTTDAAAAGDAVSALPLDAPPNRYPVLVRTDPARDDGDPAAAAGGGAVDAFARWLLDEEARSLLAEAGFEQAGAGPGAEGADG